MNAPAIRPDVVAHIAGLNLTASTATWTRQDGTPATPDDIEAVLPDRAHPKGDATIDSATVRVRTVQRPGCRAAYSSARFASFSAFAARDRSCNSGLLCQRTPYSSTNTSTTTNTPANSNVAAHERCHTKRHSTTANTVNATLRRLLSSAFFHGPSDMNRTVGRTQPTPTSFRAEETEP